MERCDLPLTDAGMGNSVYFFARTVGAFLGGILLMKYSESKFYIYSVWIALAGLILMTISTNLWFILGCVAVFGIGYANLFFHHLLSVFETLFPRKRTKYLHFLSSVYLAVPSSRLF